MSDKRNRDHRRGRQSEQPPPQTALKRVAVLEAEIVRL